MSEKDKTVTDTENKQETLEQAKERILSRRRDRTVQGKLHIDANLRDPNYVYRWVNHSADFSNVQDRQDLGYEIVRDKTITGNTSISDRTGLGSGVTKQVGHGLTGVLMRIRKDIYEEGQKIKEQAPKEAERTLKNLPGLNRETTITQSKDNSID